MSKELDFLADLKELLKKHKVIIDCSCATSSLHVEFDDFTEIPFYGNINDKVTGQIQEDSMPAKKQDPFKGVVIRDREFGNMRLENMPEEWKERIIKEVENQYASKKENS